MQRRGLAELRRVSFELAIATKNPEAAKDFYSNVLELKLIEDSPFALVFDANGTMLRIQKVQEFAPAKHTALGWHVADIRSVIDDLIRKGVRFQRCEGLPQDDLGIWRTLSGALIAWFCDRDGNILSITQFPSQ